MAPRDLEQQLTGLAALDEPVRRSLYFYVAEQRREVSRDEAAQAVGISHALAGFHLDRLASEGLLDTSFRRLSGRAGPGAGRPSKLYRRSDRQLDVSLPQRSYELAARVLAEAIDTSKGPEAHAALRKAARKIGERIGSESKARAGARAGKSRLLASTVDALAANGYEPERRREGIRLRNCPFHALVSDHRDLVCGMNFAVMEGVVDGAGLAGVDPVLDPQPDMCCVCLTLRRT